MSELKSCLEDLSNEIFMEIFDYLYGQKIFFSFFHLNCRFNLLCDYYPQYYIDTTDALLNKKTFNRLIHSVPSKHIHSLKFSAEKWISRISMEYFSSLHSLTLSRNLNPRKTKDLLEKLPSPDQLYHLSIDFQRQTDVQVALTAIFRFPNLTRLEFDPGFNRLDYSIINQPLLSLRHLSIKKMEWNDFFQLVPFIPNLISLRLLSKFYTNDVNLRFIQSNSLSKLKNLYMDSIVYSHQVDYILRLCPQVQILTLCCYPSSNADLTLIDPKEWEQILSPLKLLQKIKITISGICSGDLYCFSYGTEFWTQRNIKVYYSNVDLRYYESTLFIENY